MHFQRVSSPDEVGGPPSRLVRRNGTVSLSHGPGVRGRPFALGNPGRKRGSKRGSWNKASLISAAMLEGEQPELPRVAIEIAKRGKRSDAEIFARALAAPRAIHRGRSPPDSFRQRRTERASGHSASCLDGHNYPCRGRCSYSAANSLHRQKHGKACSRRPRSKFGQSSAIAG
jgi:hypothetical protein